jgi:hypothetical protein
VKADLERELERDALDCAVCGRTVHYVGALGVRACHWAHAESGPSYSRITRPCTFAA